MVDVDAVGAVGDGVGEADRGQLAASKVADVERAGIVIGRQEGLAGQALRARACPQPGDDVGVAVEDLTSGSQVGAITLEGKPVGAIKLIVHDNRIVRIEGNWDGAVNHGVLCEHGRYDPMNENRERITSPMLRKNGVLSPVSWDEALGEVAEKLKPLAGKEHDGVAALASTRLSAEALSMFKEIFTDGLKSDMVTSTEEGMTTAAVSSLAGKVGSFEGQLDVLRNADLVLCIGANLAASHMVAGFMVKRALPMGMRLVNIDPEASALDELADISLKPKAGSDLAVVEALQAIIVQEGLGRSHRESAATAA